MTNKLTTDIDFFSINELTPEQLARYPLAVETFTKIQRSNIDRAIQELKDSNTYTESAEIKLWAKLGKNLPGTKSALFHRLISGSEALMYPPPLVYGYPCYELVESGMAMIVTLEGFLSNVDDNGRSSRKIYISGTPWDLQDLNPAAVELLRIEYKFKDKYGDNHYAWDSLLTQEESLELLHILNKQPEFIVKDKHWGLFKLYVGRKSVVDKYSDFKSKKPSFCDVDTDVHLPDCSRDFDPDGLVNAELNGWSLEKIK